METAEFWDGYNLAILHNLTLNRALVAECQMWTRSMVVAEMIAAQLCAACQGQIESSAFLDNTTRSTTALARVAQGGGSPLVGGAGSIDACQRFFLASSVFRRGGNHPRPGLPPGETGKGYQIPCCRRLFSREKSAAGSRPSLRFGLFFAIAVPRCVAVHPELVHPSALAPRRFDDSRHR
jgi:hypothetical protein